MKLEGRKAIVTGGAQGIGLAIAKRLNAEGAKVALFDINEELVTKSAAELDGCIGVRCDVSSPASIEEAIGKVAEAFGGIDIVESIKSHFIGGFRIRLNSKSRNAENEEKDAEASQKETFQ